MIAYQDIRSIHLEISSLCNANCPLCPRNFHGYPMNGGYPEVNMTLKQAKKIFHPKFITQLNQLLVNGNFGDIVMNPEGPAILEYFRAFNPNMQLKVSTNGAARPPEFWQRLARAKVQVGFDLDGMEDTHKLYRQSTSWKQVIKNAEIFIAAGGDAIWRMISFAHNQHQISECKELSIQMGFRLFEIIDDGRNSGPVFDKNKKITHVIGPESNRHMHFDKIIMADRSQGMSYKKPSHKVICKVVKAAQIYVAANGEVYPCCWTGFYPRTYAKDKPYLYHALINKQLEAIMTPNNAIERDLKECIEWFTNVVDSWKIPNYDGGRLHVCDHACGVKP